MRYIDRLSDITETIPPIVLGCNVFGWSVNIDKSNEILDAVYDRGVNCFDTADVYPPIGENYHGISEGILGKWLRYKKRDSVVIASKIGMSKKRPGLKRKNLIEGLEESLKRLNTDYLDIYYAHCDDSSTAPDDFMHTFSDMVQSGKVRMIGVSNFSPDRLSEVANSREYVPAKVVQLHFSLIYREPFKEILSTVRSNYLDVFPYYVLEQGMLTGKYLDNLEKRKSIRGKRLEDRGLLDEPKNIKLIKTLLSIGKKYNIPPTTLAIEWVRNQPNITAPIVSITDVKQLDDVLRTGVSEHIIKQIDKELE